MLHKQRTQDQINKRCDKLESLGFICNREDIEVIHPDWDFITLDFSAVNLEDPACVMSHLIRAVYDHGYRVGKEIVRTDIKRTLGL